MIPRKKIGFYLHLLFFHPIYHIHFRNGELIILNMPKIPMRSIQISQPHCKCPIHTYIDAISIHMTLNHAPFSSFIFFNGTILYIIFLFLLGFCKSDFQNLQSNILHFFFADVIVGILN